MTSKERFLATANVAAKNLDDGALDLIIATIEAHLVLKARRGSSAAECFEWEAEIREKATAEEKEVSPRAKGN